MVNLLYKIIIQFSDSFFRKAKVSLNQEYTVLLQEVCRFYSKLFGMLGLYTVSVEFECLELRL